MNTIAPQVIADFHNLVALREYAWKDPNDLGPQFVMSCSANFAGSRSQLFQDLLGGSREGVSMEGNTRGTGKMLARGS